MEYMEYIYGSIFHSWSDVGSIGHLLDLSTAPRNVSGKEGMC